MRKKLSKRLPEKKFYSKNKSNSQIALVKIPELTLEDVEKLFDRVSEGPFSRLHNSLFKLEVASRSYGDTILSKMDNLQRSLGSAWIQPHLVVRPPAFLDRGPGIIKLINGENMHRVDLPPRRRIF